MLPPEKSEPINVGSRLWQTGYYPETCLADRVYFTTKRDALAWYNGQLDPDDCQIDRYVKRYAFYKQEKFPVYKSKRKEKQNAQN